MLHRKWIYVAIMSVAMATAMMTVSYAQDEKAAGGDAAPGMELDKKATDAQAKPASSPMSFMNVVTSSGFMGVILWIGLGACSVAGFALIADSFITLRQKKIVPASLVEKVRAAMSRAMLSRP